MKQVKAAAESPLTGSSSAKGLLVWLIRYSLQFVDGHAASLSRPICHSLPPLLHTVTESSGSEAVMEKEGKDCKKDG